MSDVPEQSEVTEAERAQMWNSAASLANRIRRVISGKTNSRIALALMIIEADLLSQSEPGFRQKWMRERADIFRSVEKTLAQLKACAPPTEMPQ